MNAASSLLTAPSSSSSRPRSSAGWRRLVSLSAVLAPLARKGALSRAGRLYPWMIAIGYAALFAISRRREEVPAAALLSAAVGYMSLAGGAVAWGAAWDDAPDDRSLGLVAAASERGLSPQQQRIGRLLATMRVVARSVGAPGIVLALVLGTWADVGRGARFTSALVLALEVGVYAVLFGVVFGGIARLSALVSPRHGRFLFALVVAGPYLVPSEFDAPSLVTLFSTLLHRILIAVPGGVAG